MRNMSKTSVLITQKNIVVVLASSTIRPTDYDKTAVMSCATLVNTQTNT